MYTQWLESAVLVFIHRSCPATLPFVLNVQLQWRCLQVVKIDDMSVVVIDIRMPCTPAAVLTAHTAPCNGVVWAPHSGGHLCTVSDDKRTLIWDICSIPVVSTRTHARTHAMQVAAQGCRRVERRFLFAQNHTHSFAQHTDSLTPSLPHFLTPSLPHSLATTFPPTLLSETPRADSVLRGWRRSEPGAVVDG